MSNLNTTNDSTKTLLAILTILAGINGLFVKRLIDQVDKVQENVVELRQDVAVLKVIVEKRGVEVKKMEDRLYGR